MRTSMTPSFPDTRTARELGRANADVFPSIRFRVWYSRPGNNVGVGNPREDRCALGGHAGEGGRRGELSGELLKQTSSIRSPDKRRAGPRSGPEADAAYQAVEVGRFKQTPGT